MEIAIETGQIEEWRQLRILRNEAFKFIEAVKKAFFIEHFKGVRNIWPELGYARAKATIVLRPK